MAVEKTEQVWFDGEFVPFERAQVPIAFALWEGSDGQRDGLKSVSEDWILVDLSAQ